MPSASDRMRNNVRAGLFVLITLLLALAVIFVLGDVKQYFTGPIQYGVTFPVESGVKNLSGGSDVRVGGISMGRVTSVELLTPANDVEPARMIEVLFTLAVDVRLYSNAEIAVTAPLIGSEAWLDISSLGGKDRDVAAELLEQGDTLAGASGGTMLDSLLGPNAKRVDNIIANVESGTAFFAGLDKVYASDVQPFLVDAKDLSGNAREFMTDLNTNKWPAWADQVSQIMSRVNKLTENVDSAVANADGLIQDGRDVVAENRDFVRQSMVNIESTTADAQLVAQRVREETLDQVYKFLATGQDGLDKAVAVLDAVRIDYDGWSPKIDDTLTNASLTSQQLKFAGMEVRRSPWKLLYRPSADELEHELLYEAARSFALAATDLKAASTTAQRILENHGDQLRDDPELLRRVTENLIDPLEQYERAQARMFDILKLEP